MHPPSFQRLLLISLLSWACTCSSASAADLISLCKGWRAQSPVAIEDGHGGILIAWEDLRTGQWVIMIQRLTDSGAPAAGWPASGRPVAASAFSQGSAHLATDGSGGAFVFWQESRENQDHDIDIFAQRITQDGSIAEGWPADGIRLVGAPGHQFLTGAVTDGEGGVFAVWEGATDGIMRLFAQRLSSTGALNSLWPAEGVSITPSDGIKSFPAVVADGNSACYVAWLESVPGRTSLRTQRILANRSAPIGWPDSGLSVSDFPLVQGPRLAAGRDGAAYVVWCDFRTGEPDLYCQRLTADADRPIAWVDGGIRLVDSPGRRGEAVICPDLEGGIYAAWDQPGDRRTDVYVQHLMPGGIDPGWSRHGTLVCGAVADQFNPSITADESGVMISWLDQRDRASWDPYARRLLKSGAASQTWPIQGMRLTDAPGGEYDLVSVSDASGGAFFVWENEVAHSNGISIQHASSQGAVGSRTLLSHDSSISLYPPRPSPSRGETRIDFHTGGNKKAHILILDVGGRLIRSWDPGDVHGGTNVYYWDGLDAQSRTVRNGLYFVQLRSGNEVATQRILVAR